MGTAILIVILGATSGQSAVIRDAWPTGLPTCGRAVVIVQVVDRAENFSRQHTGPIKAFYHHGSIYVDRDKVSARLMRHEFAHFIDDACQLTPGWENPEVFAWAVERGDEREVQRILRHSEDTRVAWSPHADDLDAVVYGSASLAEGGV